MQKLLHLSPKSKALLKSICVVIPLVIISYVVTQFSNMSLKVGRTGYTFCFLGTLMLLSAFLLQSFILTINNKKTKLILLLAAILSYIAVGYLCFTISPFFKVEQAIEVNMCLRFLYNVIVPGCLLFAVSFVLELASIESKAFTVFWIMVYLFAIYQHFGYSYIQYLPEKTAFSGSVYDVFKGSVMHWRYALLLMGLMGGISYKMKDNRYYLYFIPIAGYALIILYLRFYLGMVIPASSLIYEFMIIHFIPLCSLGRWEILKYIEEKE